MQQRVFIAENKTGTLQSISLVCLFGESQERNYKEVISMYIQ